jgi:tetratricopeptide (TPR) repeat protein
VVTGFVLAERSLFFPSVGVVIGIAVLFDRMLHLAASEGRGRRWITAAIAVLLTFGIARSSLRNVVWRDNESLFFKTVEDAPTSARAHMMLATLYSDRGQMPKALEETTLALQLGSSNDRLLLAFAADMFQMGGKCHSAAPLYERSLSIEPDQAQVRLNAAICLTRIGEFEKARTTARGASASSRRDPRLEKIARLADSTLMRSAAGIPASSDSEDTN